MFGRFYWMLNSRWTIKNIRLTFTVPSTIARHIQVVGLAHQGAEDVTQAYLEASEIAAAHRDLCNGQIGF